MIPVYFVIVRQHLDPERYAIWDIVDVIKGKMDDYESIWKENISPSLHGHYPFHILLFYREPNNLFREKEKKNG